MNSSVPGLQHMKDTLDKKGEEFRVAVGKDGRRVEWRSALDFPAEVLAREARASDIVIVGNKLENPDRLLGQSQTNQPTARDDAYFL
jgi:hypothetical protein